MYWPKFKRQKLWWEKLQENTKENGKESFNGTPKPMTMGCCQKEAQSR
jgi:hypothetical protein